MIPPKKEYTEEEVITILEGFCDHFKRRSDAAKALGIGRVFLWRVLEGHIKPTDSILQHVGLKREKETIYRYKAL